MRERVGQSDTRWQGTAAELVATREKVYCDFTILRASQVTSLSEEEWKLFMDRRWNQFALCGFTMTPPHPSPWLEFWRTRHAKKTLEFHTKLPAYTRKAVAATKQKLRELADKARAADKVTKWGGEGRGGGFGPWLVPAHNLPEQCKMNGTHVC